MDSSSKTTKLYMTFGCLLVLLVLTLAASFVFHGTLGLSISLTIAILKMALIAAIFMELTTARTGVRLAASGGLLWLTILVTCVIADYGSRGWKEASPHRLQQAEQGTTYDRIEP